MQRATMKRATLGSHGRVLMFLLGSVFGLASSPDAVRAQACPPPPGYTNTTTVQEGNLRVTMATDHYDYLVNQAVNIHLSFENTGATTLTIPNPSSITPLESFLIIPASCPDLGAPGCHSSALFLYPGSVFFFGSPVVLAPGACRTYAQQWHGTPRFGGTTPPGFYAVIGGLHSGLGEFHAPTGGARLTIRINPELPVPTETVTWGGVKLRAER